ncbi:MAG: ribosomal-processing cysteine protease Prp [Clostridia bacterium]|nr:ribosomal-processing cysteine protease Prp [Clostridia bacterium]
MTIINILEKNNNIISIECKGHSGFARSGKDIVCSAVSSILGACLLGLKEVVKINVEHKQNDKIGYFLVKIQDGVSEQLMEKAQILLQTTILSLIEISQDYKDFVTVNKIGGLK